MKAKAIYNYVSIANKSYIYIYTRRSVRSLSGPVFLELQKNNNEKYYKGE